MTALFKIVMHSVDSELGPLNPIVNVFGYRSNVPVLDEINELADSFISTIPDAVSDILVSTTSINRVEVYNVSDGIGYVDRLLIPPVVGAISGDPMPGFVAMGFKYQRLEAGKRSGSKRFGRIAESEVFHGHIDPGFVAAANTLASVLAAPLNIGITNTWFPEILERKPSGVFPWTSHPIAGVVYRDITSQNSRKR